METEYFLQNSSYVKRYLVSFKNWFGIWKWHFN